MLNKQRSEDGSSKSDRSSLRVASFEMRCRIATKINKRSTPSSLLDDKDFGESITATSGRLPDFNYCVEVVTTEQGEGDADLGDEKAEDKDGGVMSAAKLVRGAMRGAHRLFTRASMMAQEVDKIIHYNFVVHSPILLENLLPVEGVFQLVHATMNRPLYSGKIGAGKVKAIHTVNSSLPVILKIWLSYCGSKEGVRLAPLSEEPEERVETTIKMLDSENQVLNLNVETTMGNAGQRHVVVFCPYWIVNLTQFPVQLRESTDHSGALPAGSVSAGKDGSKTINESWWSNKEKRQYPGMPGPLAGLDYEKPRQGTAASAISPHALITDHSLETSSRYAYLFNFSAAAAIAAQRKVVVQLDGEGDWCTPVNLESMGMNQKLGVAFNPPFTATGERNDRTGMLEVGLSIIAAPGRLSRYTKIARFTPAYIVTNKTSYNLALTQDRFSWRQDDFNKRHIRAHASMPYYLPEVNGERQFYLSVDGDGPLGPGRLWRQSPSLELDFSGKQTVAVKKRVDLSALPHVRVRNQEVSVDIAPGEVGDEFGVWFENSDEHSILVRNVKKDSYAAQKNIQVGDQLIKINGRDVERHDFDEALTLLKNAVRSDQPCSLEFRTVEEIRRRIRDDARSSSRTAAMNQRTRAAGTTAPYAINRRGPRGKAHVTRGAAPETEVVDVEREVVQQLRVDIEYVESAVLLSVSDVPTDERPIYRVDNDLHALVIYFRQKGITDTRWISLEPGESAPYIWDEPLKDNLLRLRVGENRISPDPHRPTAQRPKKEEVVISFNSLGKVHILKYEGEDGVEKRLRCEVGSDGPTRVLRITADHASPHEQQAEASYANLFVADQILLVDNALTNLRTHDGTMPNLTQTQAVVSELVQALASSQVKKLPSKINTRDTVAGSRGEQRDGLGHKLSSLASYSPAKCIFGPSVGQPNQIHLQIFEARQLAERSSGEMPDVYTVVQLQSTSNLISRLSHTRAKSAEAAETLNPQWENQIFIINVPDDAVASVLAAKKYHVRILVKYKSKLLDSTISETSIPLTLLLERAHAASLPGKNASPWVSGWLYLKSMLNDASTAALNDAGSMKISCRWVHNADAYAHYIIENLQRRRQELEELSLMLKATNKLVAAQRRVEDADEKRMNPSSARQARYLGVGGTGGQKDTARRGTFVRKFTLAQRTNRQAMNDTKSLLSRKPWVLDACFQFFRRFDQESARHYYTARMIHGTVNVHVLEAKNIHGIESRSIGVRLTHRDHQDNEHRLGAGVHNPATRGLGWPHGANRSLAFDMNLLNTSGFIRVSLIEEGKVRGVLQELFRVDLPVYNTIEAVGTLAPGEIYERWFPLLVPSALTVARTPAPNMPAPRTSMWVMYHASSYA
jgi:hypothetical protein